MKPVLLFTLLSLCAGTASAADVERQPLLLLRFEDRTDAVQARGGVVRAFDEALRRELGIRSMFRILPADARSLAPPEAGLSSAEPVDAARAVALGKESGARYLLTGVLLAFDDPDATSRKRTLLYSGHDQRVQEGSTLTFELRLIDARDGRVALQRRLVGVGSGSVTSMPAQPSEYEREQKHDAGSRAVLGAAIEGADYLECELVARDQCLAEYADPNEMPKPN
jgi:hypothetical protein